MLDERPAQHSVMWLEARPWSHNSKLASWPFQTKDLQAKGCLFPEFPPPRPQASQNFPVVKIQWSFEELHVKVKHAGFKLSVCFPWTVKNPSKTGLFHLFYCVMELLKWYFVMLLLCVLSENLSVTAKLSKQMETFFFQLADIFVLFLQFQVKICVRLSDTLGMFTLGKSFCQHDMWIFIWN